MVLKSVTLRFYQNPLAQTSWVLLLVGTAALAVLASRLPDFHEEQMREYALEIAEAVLEGASTHAQPYFNLGRLQSRLGRFTESEDSIKQGLRIEPNRPDMYQVLGEIRIRQNKFDEAIAFFRKALDLDPNAANVHRRIGMALAHDGDDQGARKEYEQELKRNPNDGLCRFLLGQVLLQGKEYEEAERHLKEACRLDPTSVNAFYTLAQTQTRLGQRKEAAETLKTFRKLKKNDMAAMDREAAEEDDEKTLRELARSVHMDAVSFYLSCKRWPQAETHLRRATEIDPQDVDSREVLASFLHQAGRLRETISIYHEVVRINPRDAGTLADLGTMYAVLKEYEPAVANLKKAIELDPNMPEALNNLTRIYLGAQRELPEALEMAERLASQHPSAVNFDLLAWAYFVNGGLKEALEASATSIELDPTNQRYRRRYTKLRRLQ